MSDAPQQHGWQPPGPEEQADKAQSQRGFGLFDAPEAPEEFPVFTPFSQLGQSQSAEEFPPDSNETDPASSFPGFPSEEPAYVPAPAAMPIPGVAHDAFASDVPKPAAPVQPETPETPEAAEPSVGGPAGSWSAFAAGDAPRPPATPPPWEAPQSLTSPDSPPFPGFSPGPAATSQSGVEAQSFTEPSAPPAAFSEPSAPAFPDYGAPPFAEPAAPAFSDPPAPETPAQPSYAFDSSDAAAHYPSSPAPHFPSSPAPYFPGSPAAPGDAESAGSSASYDASPSYDATPGYSDPPPAAFTGSDIAQAAPPTGATATEADVNPPPAVIASDAPQPNPVPAQAQPSAIEEAAASGAAAPVRAAASAPVANRLTPAEVPPPTTKPAGRVYGSAAAAPVSPAPAAEPPRQADPVPSQPSESPWHADATSMPQRADAHEPSPQSGAAAIRATARPVHIVQPDPSDQVPTGRSSTIYGSPPGMANGEMPPARPGMAEPPPPPPHRPGRPHAFGDLLPASGGGAPGIDQQQPPAPVIPVQRGPQQPPPAPISPNPASVSPGPPSPQPAPLGPPRVDPQQARFDQFTQQPPRVPDAPPELKPERKGRLIALVVAGCAALLAVAFGGLYGLDMLVSGTDFKVGECVKQVDDDGVTKATCTEAGAFQIVSSVGDKSQCDQTQPFVQQDDTFFCLKPASSLVDTPSPQASPSP